MPILNKKVSMPANDSFMRTTVQKNAPEFYPNENHNERKYTPVHRSEQSSKPPPKEVKQAHQVQPKAQNEHRTTKLSKQFEY